MFDIKKKYNIPLDIEKQLICFAKKYDIEKIILFGSRARQDNLERSDVDLIVFGGDFNSFYFDTKENIYSLLMFDIINGNKQISRELENEIKKDGVIIYEKNREF